MRHYAKTHNLSADESSLIKLRADGDVQQTEQWIHSSLQNRKLRFLQKGTPIELFRFQCVEEAHRVLSALLKESPFSATALASKKRREEEAEVKKRREEVERLKVLINAAEGT